MVSVAPVSFGQNQNSIRQQSIQKSCRRFRVYNGRICVP